MSLKKNKALLFDMDGTLFDTSLVNFYAYKAALNEFGYDLTEDFFWKEFHGNAYSYFLPLVIGENNKDLKAIHTFKKEIYPTFLYHARMNHFLFDTIHVFRNTHHIGLVTSASKQNVNDLLHHFQVFELFDLIVTQESVVNPKPSSEGYVAAMNHFNVQPENVVIYEDSEVGLKAALASNAKVIQIIKF